MQVISYETLEINKGDNSKDVQMYEPPVLNDTLPEEVNNGKELSDYIQEETAESTSNLFSELTENGRSDGRKCFIKQKFCWSEKK